MAIEPGERGRREQRTQAASDERLGEPAPRRLANTSAASAPPISPPMCPPQEMPGSVKLITRLITISPPTPLCISGI